MPVDPRRLDATDLQTSYGLISSRRNEVRDSGVGDDRVGDESLTDRLLGAHRLSPAGVDCKMLAQINNGLTIDVRQVTAGGGKHDKLAGERIVGPTNVPHAVVPKGIAVAKGSRSPRRDDRPRFLQGAPRADWER